MEIRAGARVELSEAGRILLPRRSGQVGTVVRVGRTSPAKVHVMWDGYKSTQDLDPSFLKLVCGPPLEKAIAGQAANIIKGVFREMRGLFDGPEMSESIIPALDGTEQRLLERLGIEGETTE